MNVAYQTILIAPSAYKGTLSAIEVAQAIADGVRLANATATVISTPIADGGDGTLDALHAAIGGVFHPLEVHGALGQSVQSGWLELNGEGIIELACTSGLGMLAGQELQPMDAHTIGTGEALRQCLGLGFSDVVVCVGGSASTDGGTGILRALGDRFFDDNGMELPPGGGALARLARCDLSLLERWSNVRIRLATDVTSPLCGPTGAAFVFAPQKGASAQQVLSLDYAMSRCADVLEETTGRKVRHVAGAGAAGGAAFGLACAMGAEIVSGFAWLAETTDMERKVRESDLVISAEGSLDEQSVVGKATGELAKLCLSCGKPLWVFPAVAQANVNWSDFGIDCVVATSDGSTADARSICDKVRLTIKERHT
jgi:glycerate kinase